MLARCARTDSRLSALPWCSSANLDELRSRRAKLVEMCGPPAAISPIGRLGSRLAGPQSGPTRPSDGAHGLALRHARAH